MRDLPVDLYPSAPPLIQVRGKPATNQPLKQGYIVTKDILELVQVDIPDLSFMDKDVIRTMKLLIMLVCGSFWIWRTFKVPVNFAVSIPPNRTDPNAVSWSSRYKLYTLRLMNFWVASWSIRLGYLFWTATASSVWYPIPIIPTPIVLWSARPIWRAETSESPISKLSEM